jgi:uncharacterized membrane protein YGL010W
MQILLIYPFIYLKEKILVTLIMLVDKKNVTKMNSNFYISLDYMIANVISIFFKNLDKL